MVSVLGGGGIWNAAAVPASRTSALVPLVTLLLVVLAGVRGGAAWGRPGGALLGLAGVGLVLACAGALPGLRDVLRGAVEIGPAAGLPRDGQTWAVSVIAAHLVALAAILAAALWSATRAVTGCSRPAQP